ncbi:hypothetical protein [Streptomyces sp. NBC_00198]|uniref:hypothetical protein n=1 Tax=Streptomyces sp. NBC_00198 TaxID=2975677 RepID=UPI002257ACDD|nr:hypothetical protein [Streptomyces sp. NBC_00198]MCX5285676.1 hypothetical protein [Streptomyces sp. NBC_00198]MCX5286222.1 hypothetical protein [Streptomyces sp. NBC_00198]
MGAVVTAKGREIIAGRMRGSSPSQAEPLNLAWGQNPAGLTAAVTDVGLFKEASESRVAGTSSVVTTTTPSDTYQVTGTFTSGSTQSIAEVALSDSASKPTAVDAVQTSSTVIGSNSATSLIVANGANFSVNQYIQVRTEVLKITAISTNTLTVLRAQNGSTAISTIALSDVVTGGNIPGVSNVTNGSLYFHADHGAQNLASGDQVSYTLTVKHT